MKNLALPFGEQKNALVIAHFHDFRLPFLATGKFGFHFSLEGWLEVSFSLTAFEEDTGFVDASFETTHCIIDGLVLTNSNFDGHSGFTSFSVCPINVHAFESKRKKKLFFRPKRA